MKAEQGVVLVTGGAGYIGAHTTLELLAAGLRVVVVDNLSNGSREALYRVEGLAKRKLVGVVEADVRDRGAMKEIFSAHDVSAVVHFAALKAVGESVLKPLEYYDNNVGGLLVLVEAMRDAGVKRLVFSSSATVYGDPASVPIDESFPTSATNPYGRTKLVCEEILADLAHAEPAWRIAALRYFNPVGAHPSGRIGEDPAGVPNNLMPYISQVAVGRRPELQVFGGDYPTSDGTGVRDYIHVVDLALGHVRALERIDALSPFSTINLGTGRGYSVLELVKAFELACGRRVPYRVVERRAGDIAECWANPAKAQALLGWRAVRGLEEMCADAWRWQSGNPAGYGRE
ncbi:UDP-glucose 4-epimerase GalE [Azoarcus sp. DD4]|uniref:UDP-glucose 4-epimerase GalE n=1 Tax=Azoarcus sp. DD4 TaxID=2027405 RepID=UPI001125F763|nr:UDP-glucose 4-epimerase GalE [Azoarcus sp. DD4]QDF98779.1 UDP-glucose 4-epimerase GalE [Azoarcus sp. DD4]